MTEYNQNVKIHRGDTRTLFVELNNEDGSDYTPPAGVDIQYRMSRQWQDYDHETLVRKSLGKGIALVIGGCNIELASADTDFYPGLYYHELKIRSGTDVVTTMTGTFFILPSLHMGMYAEPATAALTLTRTTPTIS